REGEHFSKERGVLNGQRQHRIEFVEFCLRTVVAREASSTLHLTNDRIESAISVLWRAEVTKARMPFRGEAFQQRCGKPCLSDPWFSRQEHDLAFAGL